jgi:hypothetical protein
VRRALGGTIAILILSPAVAAEGASADPLNAPAYVANCGGTIYNVVSPDHSATGADVNSTAQLIAVRQGVPLSLLTFCTATPVGGGESFSGYFLITPAA